MEHEPICVDRRELGLLLRTFRRRRDETPKVVETRWRTAVRQLGKSASPATLDPTKLTGLEKGGSGELTLTEADWRSLADAYGLPQLMLDPLRVPSVNEPCYTSRLDRLVRLGAKNAREYGDGVRYSAPDAKRAGTEETAFVLLELDAGGRSQVHAHPGDELLFVLEGSVEAHLESSGLTVRLAAGDHLHFYAEQRHGVANPGRVRARVLVVRFYQLVRSGTRSELLRQLRRTRQDHHLTRRVVGDMLALLAPPDLREEDYGRGEVRDRGGLGRLLQLLASDRFRAPRGPLSVRDVATGLQKRNRSYTHSKVDRIHHGLAPVPADELVALAGAYEAEPLLLYEFLFPTWRPAVAVQHDRDWRDVPAELLGTAGGYRVPCRRLADSDLGVARLALAPGTATPLNRHPGHELLVPLAGCGQIRLAELATEVVAGTHLFAHYTSEIRHQVVNPGPIPFEALVARFYE